MQPSKAIIIGSAIIGACVLANLGYTISRDRAVAEAARREQEQQVKAAAENYKRVQSKEAWKEALKFIDVDFRKWLETQVKSDKNHRVIVRWAWTKAFALSDIQWDDERHITVHGIIGATSEEGGTNEHLFTWTRKVELWTDGVDNGWHADPPIFGYATLTQDQYKDMPTQQIIMPDQEIELVR